MRWLLLAWSLGVAAWAAEPIDLNLATEQQLAQVPGLGPAKARAIVAYRRENGPFRRVAHLERVSGIGPSTVEKLAPHFVVGDLDTAREAVRADRDSAPPYAGPVIDINTADVAGLDALPGVGRTKAQAIFDDREKRGPFRSCRALERVPGIGASTVDQLLVACVASRPERSK